MNLLIFLFAINCLILKVMLNEYPLFIYSDNHGIHSSVLESNNTFKLCNNTLFSNHKSHGMDYSLNKNLIIYTNLEDYDDLYMSSISLKSTNEKKFTSGHPYSKDIAIDWIHNLVYFNKDKNIHVMNISNKRMRAIIAYNEKFDNIVVNPLESFIVWSKCWPNQAIIKANQDGSNRTVLVNKDLGSFNSIIIDFETKRVYIIIQSYNVATSEHGEAKLSSIDFNGNDRKPIYKIKTRYFVAADIYDKDLYIYYHENNEFMKISTNGLITNKIKLGDDTYVRSIRIIHSSRQPNLENKCIDSKCAQLCLPIYLNEYRCLCPNINAYNLSEICKEYVCNQVVY